MMRRTLASRNWTQLAEYASSDADQAAFRAARAADVKIKEKMELANQKPQPIDWQ
jgi:hypothetical protein